MTRCVMILAVMVAVGALLLGAGTFAWYTGSASNPDNTFATGTVDVEVERNMGDPVPGPMFYTANFNGNIPPGYSGVTHPTGPWYPGMSVTRVLDVHNSGSLDFRVDAVRADLFNVADPAAAAEFAAKLNVRITDNVGSLVLYDGPLSALLGGWYNVPFSQQPYVANGGSTYPLHFQATLANDAGNLLQGITPMVNFWLHVTQAQVGTWGYLDSAG